MKITVLTENTACKNIGCAHGLSLCIETAKHKILFDAGPKGELLLENAKHLGIDLTDVDIVQLAAARSKSIGRYHMMMGENPIYIISCSGRGEEIR